MGMFDTLKIVGVGMVICLVIMVWAQMAAQKRKERSVGVAADDIASRAVAKFPAYRGCLTLGGIGHCLFINNATRMTLVATPGFAKEIPFDKYIAANIVTDGMTMVETRKSGIAGRAVAGGLIGGGAGAIVGALSAKSVQNQMQVTTSIALIVETTDETFPAFGWTYFEPFGLMQDLKPYEVWIYMQNAIAAYNSLAPLFALHVSEQNGLVAI